MSELIDFQARINQLEKENRVLRKKMERANATCLQLEGTLQKKESLLRQAINELKESQMSLEQRVIERTAELQTAKENVEVTLKELQNTQSQLIHAEKMSSLGQLVAGVAHEVNNPVNFIHGNLKYLSDYAEDLFGLLQLYQQHYPEPVSEIEDRAEEIDMEFLQTDLLNILASMQVGTDRICQIVTSLRNFSRLDEADFKSVNIHEGIESTLLILQHRLKDRPGSPAIEIIREYGDLPRVECYPGQLNQVFTNILANAIDALEEAHAELNETKNQEKSSQITIQTAILDANWVKITITDNGTGMPESVRQKIFNPFFTTKPVGQGTGMGMSISYKIITEKHKGRIDCCSIPSEGTEFMIQIPIQQ